MGSENVLPPGSKVPNSGQYETSVRVVAALEKNARSFGANPSRPLRSPARATCWSIPRTTSLASPISERLRGPFVVPDGPLFAHGYR